MSRTLLQWSISWKTIGNDPSYLVSISTGTVASPDESTDLLAAREKWEHAFKEYEQQRIQRESVSTIQLRK